MLLSTSNKTLHQIITVLYTEVPNYTKEKTTLDTLGLGEWYQYVYTYFFLTNLLTGKK